MFYFVKTPGWLKKLYKQCTWSMPAGDKIIYLSFDDGPHPAITPFVLDELKKYNAKASFFCIGKNVMAYPDVYKRIIDEGHATGNHSFNHLDGMKTNDILYLNDIAEARKVIDSNLYRPPYGRIKRSQLKQLGSANVNLKTIMWSVLSGDFDGSVSPEECLKNVLSKTEAGSIVVFHDSEKANTRMRYALSGSLKYFSGKGYRFDKIIL
ncbi:MAG: polysaccharide deacetylase family protein [Ferruginibacter sp.]